MDVLPDAPAPARLARRLAARAVDVVPAAVLWVLVAASLTGHAEDALGRAVLALLLPQLGYAAAQTQLQARTGASFGKALLGVRVVDAASGQPVGLPRTVFRSGARVVLHVPPSPHTALQRLADAPVLTGAVIVGTLLAATAALGDTSPDRTPRAAPNPPSLAQPSAAASPFPSADASASASADATSRTTPLASPAAGALSREDLEGRLLRPGPDYEAYSDEQSGLGDLSLDEVAAKSAASGVSRAEARAGLRRLRLERARGHAYAGELSFSTVVYRFRTASDADRLIAQARQAGQGTAFRSETVPGAFTFSAQQNGLFLQKGLFARSGFSYEVTVASTDDLVDHTVFDALLKRQRDLAEQSDPVPGVPTE